VYLITIDTLRADHVGCYGYKQVETPALDALAAEGVRFTQAFTHSPITNTSHITILTGLLPSVHGVTDLGIPLSPQHVTAAELLKKHGYHTAAFIGAARKFSNPILPAPCRTWKRSPKLIRETLPPCGCSREPIADSAESKTPSELQSRPERRRRSNQRNQLRP
jgi:hypothetical protein